MPFIAIKGTFHVTNYSPDGDSIRFQPENLELLERLAGFKAKVNNRNHVQLRIEAIDTLETHFSPPSGGGALHQPLPLARKAAESLLDFVGIKNVAWNSGKTTVVSAHDGTPGSILTRAVEKNGRPIAFVYAGDLGHSDGAEIQLDIPLLRKSYNYYALSKGLAYPTYYKGLFADIRAELSAVATKARNEEDGIFEKDVTTKGFAVSSLKDLTDNQVILPKLFRRLSEYIVNNGSVVGFKAKMAQSREPVLDLKTQNFTHFDTFIEETGSSIKLTRLPEELVFDEMKQRPAHPFSALMGKEPRVLDYSKYPSVPVAAV